MALLAALVAIGFQRLIVCHLDHGLRGRASRADANLVRQTAHQLGLGFESARAATRAFAAANGFSIELAARELRYAFFAGCAKRHRCRSLLLAHHADDQVETCLYNFLRGSGAAGLAGMRVVTDLPSLKIIRPLLGATRGEIREYVDFRKIAFREDASNRDASPMRNRIRHRILPVIEREFGDSFRGAILRASGILRMDDEFLEAQVPRFAKRISCHALRGLPLALRYRATLGWLRRSGISEPGFAETQRVLSLLDVDTGPAKINLPGDWHARRRAGQIFLEKGRE